MTYHHGVKVSEPITGARALREASTAVIGMSLVGGDADADFFPLNTPVLLTDVRAAIAKAGDEDELPAALEGIADVASPIAVVVRVAEGTGETAAADTIVNIKAGLDKLLSAQSTVGVKPRIIGCPGRDGADVTAHLALTAAKLRGFAYASAMGAGADTVAEAITYRATYEARELMLLYPDFKKSGVTVSAVARALGLRALLDETQGWHKSLSNVPVTGVSGLSLPVSWELQDASTDAGLLNAAQITTIVNAAGGYRFWGSRTCDDTTYLFETSTRTAQVLADTVAAGQLWAIDKPLHPSLARDIVETINAKFRQYVSQGKVLGGEAWFDPSSNSPATLAAGELYIDYDYTEVPPLENLQLRQRRTNKYLLNFAGQVAAFG